jgi:hypothetical protein
MVLGCVDLVDRVPALSSRNGGFILVNPFSGISNMLPLRANAAAQPSEINNNERHRLLGSMTLKDGARRQVVAEKRFDMFCRNQSPVLFWEAATILLS